MLHQWFTCVHLLDTYLANLTEDFQLSFTTHQFPSEQHKVVCNQHLHAECGGSATISLEVTTESIKYSQYRTSFCLRTHANSKYTTILVPQSGIQKLTITIGDKDYIYDNGSPFSFDSGKITTINLEVGRDEIILNDVKISDWEPGKTFGGEALD